MLCAKLCAAHDSPDYLIYRSSLIWSQDRESETVIVCYAIMKTSSELPDHTFVNKSYWCLSGSK